MGQNMVSIATKWGTSGKKHHSNVQMYHSTSGGIAAERKEVMLDVRNTPAQMESSVVI